MRGLVLPLALLGCGRLDFDARQPEIACTQWGDFALPVRLPAINVVGDDWSPTPRGDTELYFHSYRPGSASSALWRATRAAIDQPFGDATRIAELDSPDDEKDPSITDDGLELVFQLDTQTTHVLLGTTRATTGDPWSAPAELAASMPGVTDQAPWISGDGLRLVFASDRGAAGALDLFEATRPTRDTAWSTPVELASLNGPNNDTGATLSADGLEILFASSSSGGLDIFTSRRPALDQPFAPPAPVMVLDSPLDDTGLRLTADGSTLYLNYDTLTQGGGDADMWMATRSCVQ